MKYKSLEKINSMTKAIFVLIIALGLALSDGYAQEAKNKTRLLSLSYTQRLHFASFEKYEQLQSSQLPELNNNARFHGMHLHGAVSKSLIVGLYAQGSLNDANNELGYTNWGGGIGAVTFQYNYSPIKNMYIFPGFGFGCGRFNYSSSINDGSQSFSIYSDAIYFEPRLNVGYALWNKLLIMVEGTYMLGVSGNNYTTGNTNIESCFPEGWFIGLSIGYNCPFYKW